MACFMSGKRVEMVYHASQLLKNEVFVGEYLMLVIQLIQSNLVITLFTYPHKLPVIVLNESLKYWLRIP